jgi:two-component system response regulator
MEVYISMKEKKVLLIEDDPDHAGLITDVLKEDNIKDIKAEIILKKDGQEAIDYFQYEMQPQVSFVILDLNLPKIDGMDVLKFIKKNPKYHSIPVFIFSTSSRQKTIDEAYKNGANAYIIKPDSYKDFVEKINILKQYW